MPKRFIVPVLTYVQMTLIAEQVRLGRQLTIPMKYIREGPDRVPARWEEQPDGDPEDVALTYLSSVLYASLPKDEGQRSRGYGDPLLPETVKKYWQRLSSPKKKLPVLTPYRSIALPRDQYVKDLICRCEDLADFGDGAAPFARAARLIESAVSDRLNEALKPKDGRPVIPNRLGKKLEEVAVARGGFAIASLRGCIEELVCLGAEESQHASATLHVPELPAFLKRAEADGVAREAVLALRAPHGRIPPLIVVGATGSGRRVIMAEVIQAIVSKTGSESVFWNRWRGETLRQMLSAAVLSRNGNTDEEERFDQAVRAIAAQSRGGGSRKAVIALSDVDADALASGSRELERMGDAGALVIASLAAGDGALPTEWTLDGAKVFRIGPVDERDLILLGKAQASSAGRGVVELRDRDVEAIARLCSGNVGLNALSCAVAARLGFPERVTESLSSAGLDPVDKAMRVLGAALDNDSALGALSLLPPEGASAETARSLVSDNVSLLIDLLDIGFLMRDMVGGRIMLNGSLAEAVASRHAKNDLASNPNPSKSVLGRAVDKLWANIAGVASWSALEEATACLERLLDLLGDRESPWITLCRGRLARLYEKTGRTWLSIREHAIVLEKMEEAARSGAEMHDSRGDLINLGCSDRESSLAEEHLRLGHAQMQYARREAAEGTFEAGIRILNGTELTRERRALKARLLREKGWTAHEEWRRNGGKPGDLERAIDSKREALQELRVLSNPPATGRELQGALSTLGFSLIESPNPEDREEAVKCAREGLCELFVELSEGEGRPDEIFENPERAQRRIKRCRAQLAEALYFYGRILAGGDHPEERRIPSEDEDPDAELNERLERALLYERTALTIRNEIEPEKWNMLRAFNLASMGMINWALGRKSEARELLAAAMKIQDYRTHVTDECGRRTGKPRERGPITDWYYVLFPKEAKRDGRDFGLTTIKKIATGSS